MKKSFHLIAICLLAALSGTAQTLNLTNTPSSVSHQWNPTNWPDNYFSSELSESKLAYVPPPVFIDSTPAFANDGNGFTIYPNNFSESTTNVSYTWSAPPGMMFVVTPPPPALGPLNLQFTASYAADTYFMMFGSSGNASYNLVYGVAPTNYSGGISDFSPINEEGDGLDLEFQATIPTNGGSFAFTSVTVTYELFIPLASTWYEFRYAFWEPYAIYLSGGNAGDPTDPGPLLTLQPYNAAPPAPPTPPALGISTYGSQPAVFFPTATGTNFALQMTTNLASGNWVTVTNGTPISGILVSNPPSNAFFRLH